MPQENSKINQSVQTTKTASPGLQVELDAPKLPDYVPTPDQQQIYGYYISLLNKAKTQRDQRYTEFDNLTYEDDYELNKRAANSYLRPKVNDDEVRVVTGGTEKKIEVVQNELASLNLQHELIAFDLDDNEIKSLGNDFADVITRTNEIERDEDFWREFTRELLTQRAAFIDEVDEYQVVEAYDMPIIDETGANGSNPCPKTVYHYPRKRLLQGLQVYLGDIRLPAYRFQEQPYVVKYYRRSYAESKMKYGSWKNFSFVRQGGSPGADKGPYGYRMNKVGNDEVEEIHIIDPNNNEYMIIIQGVLMFDKPQRCPWKIMPQRRYMMSMTSLKSISEDFAYGRPLTSSAKTLQALDDEMIRLLIRKFRQALEPPLGTMSMKVFSKDIWMAGAVTQGIEKDEFYPLNPNNQGVTTSEFNMVEFIEKKVEEFIGVSKQAQGMDEKGDKTATQVLDQQKQFAKLLGHSVVALMTAKRDACYLRLYNVIENHSNPERREWDATSMALQDIYRKYTLRDTALGNGKRGKKVVQFMDRNLSDEELAGVYQNEQAEEQLGRPVSYSFINVKLLKEIPMMWFVSIVQKERSGSPLERVMFTDRLTQATAISKLTGRPLNADSIIDSYETIWQAEDMFMQPELTPSGQPVAQAGQELMGQIEQLEQSPMGDQLQEGATMKQTNKPSMNTMVGQV